jgi:phage gp29-like protein
MNKLSNKYGRGLMAACIKHEIEDATVASDALREVVAKELQKPRILDRATSLIRGPEFQRAIDEMVRDHAKALVVEVLAERDGELDAAVRRIVEERWDAAVAKAAHDILDQHLAAVRRRIG